MPYKELYKKCLDRHARGATTYFPSSGGQCLPTGRASALCRGISLLR